MVQTPMEPLSKSRCFDMVRQRTGGDSFVLTILPTRRIEACIQRFRTSKRLPNTEARFFNEYLFLGGIDIHPAPFSGHDAKDLKQFTPAEQRDLKAKDSVNTCGAHERFYNGDREKWSVDFTAVAAGFFSISLGQFTGFEPEPMDKAIAVVEDFLRYVLDHQVCPEFDADVKGALEVCKQARSEWPLLLQMEKALPGEFNLAAAQVFGVHSPEDWSSHGIEKSEVDAQVYLLSSLALLDESEHFSRLSGDLENRYVVKEYERTVEVTEIHPPDAELSARFQYLTLNRSHLSLQPIGVARFKKATIEDDWVDPGLSSPEDDLSLYFDQEIPDNMLVGQKMTLVLCETDTGFKFVRKINQVVPTFYTFLPQSMMRYYKAPRRLDRPELSSHDYEESQDEGADED